MAQTTFDPDALDGPVAPPDPSGLEREEDAPYLRVLSTVGQGGMGEVHVARDLDLGRVVALKVMSKRVANNPRHRSRFLTEAQVTAQLEHPHIVPVYRLDSGVPGAAFEGPPAFSMKLIRGRTLGDVIDRCRAHRDGTLEDAGPDEDFGLGTRLDIFVAVCDAIAYAHERGVVHRDLKPENIMVGRHGEVYVVDWGVARLLALEETSEDAEIELSSTSSSVYTRPGALMGTPAYMSPEQARSEDVDVRSDQYTLGLILQELVTLERANPHEQSLVAIAQASKATRGPMPGPLDLRAIAARACQPRPEDRYPSVTALVTDVRRFQHGKEVSVRRDGVIGRLWRWSRHHPVPSLITLGVVLGTAALVTIASLVVAVVVQGQSARAEREVARRVSAVSRRAHAIDAELLRYQSLLDGFAEQVEAAWDDERDPEESATLFDRSAFSAGMAPADYRESPSYGTMAVSFTDPLYLVAPGADEARARADAIHISEVREPMRTVFLRAESEMSVSLPPTQADALLRDEGVPPAWIYVGLESGALLNYPGHPRLSAEYDPRRRPWYTATRDTRGPRWGEPYQGDSGYSILVPCNRAIYASDGAFIGVVGLDVTLDTVIEMLDIDLDGAQQTFLVDSEGNIVVSSEQAGLNLGAGLHDNRSLGRTPLPFEAARSAITSGSPSGHIPVDDGVVIYDRMEALGFTYVVRIDD